MIAPFLHLTFFVLISLPCAIPKPLTLVPISNITTSTTRISKSPHAYTYRCGRTFQYTLQQQSSFIAFIAALDTELGYAITRIWTNHGPPDLFRVILPWVAPVKEVAIMVTATSAGDEDVFAAQALTGPGKELLAKCLREFRAGWVRVGPQEVLDLYLGVRGPELGADVLES